MISCENTTVKRQAFGGRYKAWTMDSGLDYELSYGLIYGLDFGLDWTVDGVLVGTDIYTAFSKTGWLLLLCLYSFLAQLVGK